jgi:hypothetical protein
MNTTKPCSFFIAGHCKHGDKCNYNHDNDTLQNRILSTGKSVLELFLELSELSNEDFMNLKCDLMRKLFKEVIDQKSKKIDKSQPVNESIITKSSKNNEKSKVTKSKKEKFSEKKVTKIIYNHGELEDVAIIENPPQNKGLLISGIYEIVIPLNEDGNHKFESGELDPTYYDDLLRILKKLKGLDESLITMGGFFQKYKEYKKM